MLGVFLCCCFSTLSALGSILKLQVCNFAEIKRSYENSTGSAEAVDRSPDRSRSRSRSQTRGQLWGIFNLCPALTFAWKSEQWSESPGSGLCDLIAPTVRKCTNAQMHTQNVNSAHVASPGIPISRAPATMRPPNPHQSPQGGGPADSGQAPWPLAGLAARHHYLCALPTSQII